MNWHRYFINIAKEVATKSKDPSTKVGCVIVDSNNRPVSFGYNGFVSKCNESIMTNERPLKYNLVIHAEMNALLFAQKTLHDCVLYCTHAPCDNCLKHILQTGIRTIWYDNSEILHRQSDLTKEALKKIIESVDFLHIINVNTNKNLLEELNK